MFKSKSSRIASPVTEAAPNASRTVGVWVAVFSFLCFVYFLPHWDWDQNARLDMTVALVNHLTVAIDRYHGNTGDVDMYRGHYYSSKAPGQSLVGVPFDWAYKEVQTLRGSPPPDSGDDQAALYLEAVVTAAIPATLLLFLFFWFLGGLSHSLANRALLTVALGLATNIFAYAQQLFSHVPTAALLFAGFVLVQAAAGPDSRWPRWAPNDPETLASLGGLSLGTAFLFEYPSALISFLIVVYAATRLPVRALPYLAAGAAPPILIVMAYNATVYHNPFVTGYTSGAAVVFKYQQKLGFAGFTWPPAPEAIWGLSFSSYRGLFFLSPFLLLAFLGYPLWARRGGREWQLFLAIPVLYFVAITMFQGWWGGLAVGPRYLIPMLPFLAVPVIFALDQLWRWTDERDIPGPVYGVISGLMGVSLLATWAETIGGTYNLFPPEVNHNPLFSASLPALLHGQIYLNRGMNLGLHGIASLLPLAALLILWSAVVFALWRRAAVHEASDPRVPD